MTSRSYPHNDTKKETFIGKNKTNSLASIGGGGFQTGGFLVLVPFKKQLLHPPIGVLGCGVSMSWDQPIQQLVSLGDLPAFPHQPKPPTIG